MLKEHRKLCSKVPHEKREVFQCPKCKKEYNIHNSLKSHLAYCKGVQECPICDGSFNYKEIDKHIKKCQAAHRCQICLQAFQSRKMFLEHVGKKHKDQQVFLCDFCKCCFLSEKHRLEHMALSHKEEFSKPTSKSSK